MDAKYKRLQIVEDDLGLQSQLRWGCEGFEVALCADREVALAEVQRSA